MFVVCRLAEEEGCIEKESRLEAEQHNLQLRSQLALLQQKSGKQGPDSYETSQISDE